LTFQAQKTDLPSKSLLKHSYFWARWTPLTCGHIDNHTALLYLKLLWLQLNWRCELHCCCYW